MSAAPPDGVPPLRSRLVARTPFFYGWLVLLAGSFGLFMTTPGQTLGVSVFLDGIIADLALSRTTVFNWFDPSTRSPSGPPSSDTVTNPS